MTEQEQATYDKLLAACVAVADFEDCEEAADLKDAHGRLVRGCVGAVKAAAKLRPSPAFFIFRDGELVDSFHEEVDAAAFTRDHPGTSYTDIHDASEAERHQINEQWALAKYT